MTEMGRQPWIVQGLLRTNDANSPRVSHRRRSLLTLVGFTAIFTRRSAAIALWVFLREARKGAEPEPPAGRDERDVPTSRSPTEEAAPCRRLHLLAGPLVRPHRRSCGSGTSSSRASTSASACSLRASAHERRRAARDHPHDRAGLGRQRGVADHRRRRDLRRLPRVVRDAVLGLLPGALPHPRRAHRPRRRVRVLGQGRPPAWRAGVGVGDRPRQLRPRRPAVGRGLGEHRPRRPDRRPAASSPATSSTC